MFLVARGNPRPPPLNDSPESHMSTWAEFVVGSYPCSVRFFWVLTRSPLSSKKPVFPNSDWIRNDRQRTTMWMSDF